MKIGILSDTHVSSLSPEVIQRLKSVKDLKILSPEEFLKLFKRK